tara:strand:- start:31 stop:609 length:579 start_codon:yes stop_codon:yes gene_type:complete
MSQIFDVSSEARFLSFVEELVGVIGHADRAGPLRDYCTGLLLPAERKSVEPMAAITAPSRVAAQAPVTASFRRAIALVGRNGPCQGCRDGHARGRGQIEAWIIDDTSFPKKGRHSVGVARQYPGQLGQIIGKVEVDLHFGKARIVGADEWLDVTHPDRHGGGDAQPPLWGHLPAISWRCVSSRSDRTRITPP